MAIALVRSASGSNSSGSTTVGATFAAGPAAGDFLVACIAIGSGSTVSSVASTGTTWVKATGLSTGGAGEEIWYAENVAGGGAAVTATLSGSSEATIILGEFSGIKSPSSLDRVAANANDFSVQSSISSGTTLATTQADELCIAGMMDKNPGSMWLTTVNPWFDLTSQASSSSVGSLCQYRITTVTGTQSTSASRNPTSISGPWVGAIATFKGGTASGGGGTSAGSLLMLGAGK